MTSRRMMATLVWPLLYLSLAAGSLIRKNVDTLTEAETMSLQSVLRKLEDDQTDHGFQALAAYHGEPSQCHTAKGDLIACCHHGDATFPQWHRAYVVQFEQALVEKGLSHIGVPYWDWTQPLTDLPELVKHQIFTDPNGGLGQKNAWFSAEINHGDVHEHTARAVDDRLFEHVAPGQITRLLSMVFDALEQDDYCHFEAQFEIAHNTIHYLVGGRHHYSMSTLEYTSYDPVFFLHHSNVDRLFIIWLELQKLRGKPYDHSDCSVELFNKPMQPFNSDNNPVQLTKTFNRARDLFSHLQLGYTYDDLTLNGMSMDQLHGFLQHRHGKEKFFTTFSLHGLKTSANVKVEVCLMEGDHVDHCEFAGDFFILGGANEMAWEFKVPYYFDITETVHELDHAHGDAHGGHSHGHYTARIQLYSVNGTRMDSSLLTAPYISHRPAYGHRDPAIPDGRKATTVVRKDIDVLTDEEVYHLRQAMDRFQNDTSIDGFQAVAEFHGLPAKCPHPDAAVRYACCIHGMATFPHWHRLFVTEVEDELRSRGLEIGIPYWDWTRPNTHIPALASDEFYTNPHTNEQLHNPFHDAPVAFRGETTNRDVQQDLSEVPEFGDHTALFDGMLLAFEQEDFCDFEVQFEVVHNAIHFLVGGFSPHSMSTLHYSAFDPIFFLHHSNVDRLWAIWQKLQMRRGLPYRAHCAGSLTQEILKPFGFPPPYHNDAKIHDNAQPSRIYDYEGVLDYTYDSLLFGGMTVDQLDHYLEERKTHDRTFVGIMLHNIGVSAWAELSIEMPTGDKFLASKFAVLGGEKEMSWRFDRPFKVEITEALTTLGLHYDDDFHVLLKIVDVEGKNWAEDTFSHETILHSPSHVHMEDEFAEADHMRIDVETLTREQQQNVRDAMEALMADESINGFGLIASYHGQPNWCPSPQAETKFACCAHGMAVFPHWHRLLTVQAEDSLMKHGMNMGLPYWDWTLPMEHLPELVTEPDYIHPKTGDIKHNPWYSGRVDADHVTHRNPSPGLFLQPEFGHLTPLAEKVMLAFEQDNFCDFEIQFEIAHNYIHAVVGGNELYSMASLRYTAFDPLFYLHHSNTDRIWAIWQHLQRYRGKPYNSANCAIAEMRKPLQPFAQTSVTNPDAVTRDHSVPFDVFNYRNSFHYDYDNYQFNGMSIPQLHRETVRRKGLERVFAGFMLHGIKKSALVKFEICKPDSSCKKAGEFYLLGDEHEIPWEYDRLYKQDITAELASFDLDFHDRFDIHYTVYDLAENNLGHDVFGNATVVHSFGLGHMKGHEEDYMKEVRASSHVRRDLESLTTGECESLRSALHDMEEDGTFEDIAKFHGYPGLCTHGTNSVACCVHGSPTFPHWHRLYVENVENALLDHGSAVSLPYWDWTKPIHYLPKLINQPTYYDSRSHKKELNPFFRWKIPDSDIYTSRDPQPDLFDTHYFMDNVMLALEQTSFCDFEIQFEIAHNSLHSFIGGRGKYSMSNLDYAAFDPVFFLHHANVDRIWAIWQALQKFRGLPFDDTDCAMNLMASPLHPFDNEDLNHCDVTHKYSRPAEVFDYSNNFDYHYDTLSFNSWSIPQLEEALKKQRSRDRLFAGFLLHNIHTSAVIELDVCVHTGHGGRSCNHPAGKFALLGGEFEMPFTFDRLFKYDISDTVRKLGLPLDSAAGFDLEVKVHAANGSYIDSDILPKPTIIFQPGEGKHQDEKGHTYRHLIRKNVWGLSPQERRSLVLAMRSLQADSSPDGFQSLAAFHAEPALCPEPAATHRFACCVHGMANFPQWHRLYTVQFEDALRRHGATVGIPYWDTIRPYSMLPPFLGDAEWDDPLFHNEFLNPWHHAEIEFEHSETEREVNFEKLSQKGPKGYDSWSWKQYMFALEQEDYCDFEVQFEIAHNAIHAWLGGTKEHSMAHLHYASYDPAFIIHHSNTDRVFAIWQELQKYRGHDPNEVNCALDVMSEPLKPFSFGSPYNLNPMTKEYSKAQDSFDYQGHFHYEYDHLDLQGMDVPHIQDYINREKEHDRVFAGFLLHGIGRSAHLDFSICKPDGECTHGGDFDILGGSLEMPWRFDRLFKYEITDVLHDKHLDVHDVFDIKVTLTTQNGTELPNTTFPRPSVIFDPRSRDLDLHEVPENRVRHDLSQLDERDVLSLENAIRNLQLDKTKDGYQHIASFHGAPGMCPSPDANPRFACCVHGMPTFPHWHRLYTVEMEDALIRHGSGVALPYWDWTRPLHGLPKIFTNETFYDPWRDEVVPNPFVRAHIDIANGYTVRDLQPELNKLSHDGEHSVLFDELLLALEQTDYCDFEVQFEVLHNAIHYLVGGHQKYSLATLDYSSYDPIFFVHHSFVDKVWAVWQELQKERHLSYDRADCAVNFMNQNLHPFDWEDFNVDVRTREHSMPNTVFNYEDLGYHYDNFDLGGNSLEELEELIHEKQSHARVFAGFHLHSIGTSATVTFHACKSKALDGSCVRAGGLSLLGGDLEMEWSFDRLFKYDITAVLHDIGIEPEDVFDAEAPFHLKYEVRGVNDLPLPLSTVAPPTIIFEPAKGAPKDHTSYNVAGVGVRKNINTLTTAETANLKEALRHMKEKHGKGSYNNLVKYHGYPAQCHDEDHEVACCHHGMASFPQWHRVFVKQFETYLGWEGAQLGVPYWDWTEAFTELPTLLTEDPEHNPFHHGHIPTKDVDTSRAPRPQLFRDPAHGHESFFYRQVLLALEQRDYCDFEVQLEVIHNDIHSWVGGTSPYGMSTLEYSAYDPLFFIHHSNVDRQFAIWQALQKYRHLDYNTANCNVQELRLPMEPFSREDNPVPLTRQNSRAIDAFNYDALGYQYDNLMFHGKSISELDAYLKKRMSKDRVFLNFMLHNIGTSADVKFDLCDAHHKCNFAGAFAILGGPLEMHWSFDRLFKYDVTKVFRQMGLRPDSNYTLEIHVVAVNGTELDSHVLESPSVSFVPGRGGHDHKSSKGLIPVVTPSKSEDLVRHEVGSMSLAQVDNLRNALHKLTNDHGPNGFEAIASFHGAPGKCPENASAHYSCCQHGMPAFPHWHRLLTVQFERALKEKGAQVGIPYWDWTRPSKSLPSLFTDPYGQNPFRTYHISFNDKHIERQVDEELFNHPSEGDLESLFHQALEMLEETNYCDFEVQYEMLHNAVHELVGGNKTYSMSTLDFSAFDPFFMVHHASIDRLWVIWQHLQKLRHKPFNYASCASDRIMYHALEPFSYHSVNTDPLTRENSVPALIFDAAKFHYHYDNLELNGHDVKEIEEMIHEMQEHTRFFAGFVLFGIHSSARVHVDMVHDGQHVSAGNFFVLGGDTEMPWAYERLYKLDVSDAAKQLGLEKGALLRGAQFSFDLTFTKYDGTPLDVKFPSPILVRRDAHSDHDNIVVPLRKEFNLPPKVVIRKDSKVMFHAMEDGLPGTVRELGSYTNMAHCAIPPGDAHSYDLDVPYTLEPGHYYFAVNDVDMCKNGGLIQISVDAE